MKVVKNARIPMRDGVRLAADLYLPPSPAGESFPVVLEYIPYRKDDVGENPRFYQELVTAEYVVARVDIRGTGGSEGVSVDEYTLEEQLDGVEVIEWLAGQPFCDGQVNMMGISYGAFTALQVASHAPQQLRSVIPVDFTHDRYTDDCHFVGGLQRMYNDSTHYLSMVSRNALPPDPDLGSDWARIWTEHLESNEPWQLTWLRHQTDGPYWRNGSVIDVVDQIQCPVFMIGGWRDGYANSPIELFNKLRVPRKMLMGPWDHAFPDVAVPGPRIDYIRDVVRWLDYWCKGRDTGIMDEPPAIFYVQHGPLPEGSKDVPGQWRAETSWPPPGVENRDLYLGPGGLLSDELPEAGSEEFEYDPTVGIYGGGLFSGGIPFHLPGDQRGDEAHSLVYTSAPLEEGLVIAGRPQAVLHVSSTASVMGFVVRLSDVGPDGSSHLVTKGILNATRRHSLSDPEPLTAGETVELSLPLDATSWRFAPGHRIRVAIASADFPNTWPTPEPGRNEVHHGHAQPTRIGLPTVPPDGSATPPEFSPSPALARQIEDPCRWDVVRDRLTGRIQVLIEFSKRTQVNPSTTVIRRQSGQCTVDPRNPANASVHGRWLERIDRPGQCIEAVTNVSIQGTSAHFHVIIDLNVHVNHSLHFTRSWTESIPRQLL